MPKAEETLHLGRILSPEEKSRYQAMYEHSSSAARDILITLGSRELPADKRDSIGRIRSFLAQAQEAAASDWTAAAQLAYRAGTRLFNAAGGHAIYSKGAMQRQFRNLIGAVAHRGVNWEASAADYGAALLAQYGAPRRGPAG